MTGSYDALVVGAGHNGLVAGATLAKSGRKVLVLEAREQVGGAAVTEELATGYRAPTCAHLLTHLHPKVIADLDLEKHGLELAAADLATVALDRDGSHVLIEGDTARGLNGTGPSASDQEALRQIRDRIKTYARTLAPFLTRTPPRLGTSDWEDRGSLIKLGWALRRLGRDQMRDFLRIALMNAADLFEDEIEHPLLVGALAFDSVLGGNVGPRSPGTVLSLVYRATGEVKGRQGALAIPKGGMGAVTEALAAAARAQGVEIRTAAPVARVLVDSDRAVGVALASGEEIRARAVLSNADPKRSLLGLLGAAHLDAGFAKRASLIRSKGNCAKLNLALKGRPTFTGLPDQHLGARLLIAPSVDELELAFNPTKYGELPDRPALEITLPSLHDPGLAPEGGHVLSAVVQYAPYDLRAGWKPSRSGFESRLIALIESFAPGLSNLIEASELLTPLDIEARFGITGGHWHHGELLIDQMLMLRPLYGAAQYETPVAGYYLCGAGSHPGGNVMGAAGLNAAHRVIDQEGRP